MDRRTTSDILTELENVLDVYKTSFDKRTKIYKDVEQVMSQKKPTKKSLLDNLEKIKKYLKSDKAKELSLKNKLKKEKQAEKRREKREQKDINKIKMNVINIKEDQFNGLKPEDGEYVYEAVKQFKNNGLIEGKNIGIGLYVDNKLIFGKKYTNISTLSKWWKDKQRSDYLKARRHWANSTYGLIPDYIYNHFNDIFFGRILYPDELLELYDNKNINLIIYELGSVQEKYIKQIFKGDGLCWLGEIENYYIEKSKKSKNNISKTLNKTIDKIQNLKKIYKDGLPEDDYKLICDQLNINVSIYDIFGKIMSEYKCNRPDKVKTFKFINNRFNHVDPYFGINKKVINIDEKEMNEIYE